MQEETIYDGNPVCLACGVWCGAIMQQAVTHLTSIWILGQDSLCSYLSYFFQSRCACSPSPLVKHFTCWRTRLWGRFNRSLCKCCRQLSMHFPRIISLLSEVRVGLLVSTYEQRKKKKSFGHHCTPQSSDAESKRVAICAFLSYALGFHTQHL